MGSPGSDPTTFSQRPLGSLGFLMERRASNGGVRLGVLVALLVHAAVFAISWPVAETTASESAEPEPVPVLISDVRILPRERPTPPPRSTPVSPPPEATPIPIAAIVGPPEVPQPREPTEVPDVVVPFGPVATPLPVSVVATPIVVRVGGDILPPAVIHRVLPSYTEAARHAGVQGAVILEAVIDTDGRVQDLTVLRKLPLGLTENALDAVRRWRFEPSTLDGRPVAVCYILTIRFRLG